MMAIVMVFLSAMGVVPPQCQMTLAPSARASSTTSSGAAATPEASCFSSMPRSFSEKLSASTRTPAPASLVKSPDLAPGRTGSTPFWTRNRVTSFFAAASCCARSQQKRVSFESNGSRDSINKYLGICASSTNVKPSYDRRNRVSALSETRERVAEGATADVTLYRQHFAGVTGGQCRVVVILHTGDGAA